MGNCHPYALKQRLGLTLRLYDGFGRLQNRVSENFTILFDMLQI